MTIRDDHIDNHFDDKFVPLCHVDYFINFIKDDRQKLTVGYIYRIFYT